MILDDQEIKLSPPTDKLIYQDKSFFVAGFILFFLSGILAILFENSAFTISTDSEDILVIEIYYIIIAYAIFFIFLGGIYFVANRLFSWPTSLRLGRLHLVLSLIPPLLSFLIFIFRDDGPSGGVFMMDRLIDQGFSIFMPNVMIAYYLFFAFLYIQVLLLINLILGWRRQ